MDHYWVINFPCYTVQRNAGVISITNLVLKSCYNYNNSNIITFSEYSATLMIFVKNILGKC